MTPWRGGRLFGRRHAYTRNWAQDGGSWDPLDVFEEVDVDALEIADEHTPESLLAEVERLTGRPTAAPRHDRGVNYTITGSAFVLVRDHRWGVTIHRDAVHALRVVVLSREVDGAEVRVSITDEALGNAGSWDACHVARTAWIELLFAARDHADPENVLPH